MNCPAPPITQALAPFCALCFCPRKFRKNSNNCVRWHNRRLTKFGSENSRTDLVIFALGIACRLSAGTAVAIHTNPPMMAAAGDLDAADETFREYERMVDPNYLEQIRTAAKQFDPKHLPKIASSVSESKLLLDSASLQLADSDRELYRATVLEGYFCPRMERPNKFWHPGRGRTLLPTGLSLFQGPTMRCAACAGYIRCSSETGKHSLRLLAI